MQRGKAPPELGLASGVAARPRFVDPLEHEVPLPHCEHRRHRQCVGGTQPFERGRLGLEELRWRVAVRLGEDPLAIGQIDCERLSDVATAEPRQTCHVDVECLDHLLLQPLAHHTIVRVSVASFDPDRSGREFR